MPFSFLNMRKERWSVGVDLGTEHIKVACLAKNEGHYQLMAHAFFKRENKEGIQEAFRHPEIRTGEIRVSIEDPTMKIRKVDLPQAPEEEMNEIVKWGLNDVLRESLENYLFRYYPLPGEPSEKGKPYLVFAIQKEKLQQHLSALKELGLLRPQIIEPQIHALSLSVAYNYERTKEDCYALIDFGKSLTYFAVIFSDALLFCRPLGDISGEALTLQISRDLGINKEDAAHYKVSSVKANIPQTQAATLKDTMNHFFSKVSIEVQRSMDNYFVQFPNQPITHLLLTGGGAQLSGLVKHIEETLKVPTSLLETFQKIDITRFRSEDLEEKKHYYGVATGLAL